jgi:hypothetical protein
MNGTTSYYAKKIKELQEVQKKIYEDWLNSQHQIFERYMREFQNMLESMSKGQRVQSKKIRPKKKMRRAKAKVKAKTSKRRRRRRK